ncbi:putative FAD-binding domain-containing protein [Lyophyllum shimeji]|uniref:FAD-binding domain-containing protein n=1 Tax=Lyophyllum shimeji TaxID=47721 RepID=A0A9P3PV16_LYOSH|nr:putative FAD-binding domain-containing protein [Lyophyllum shimeji]
MLVRSLLIAIAPCVLAYGYRAALLSFSLLPRRLSVYFRHLALGKLELPLARKMHPTYDCASQTAVIRAGLLWYDVYAALAPHNVNVVGGRVTGVGVAVLMLGGGRYSWRTNQYGPTIDTVAAFELVKPDGVVVNVTQASDSELFFGLKGGLNRFIRTTLFGPPVVRDRSGAV